MDQNHLGPIRWVNTLDQIPWTNTLDQNTLDQIPQTKDLVFQHVHGFPLVKVCVYGIRFFCSTNPCAYATWEK